MPKINQTDQPETAIVINDQMPFIIQTPHGSIRVSSLISDDRTLLSFTYDGPLAGKYVRVSRPDGTGPTDRLVQTMEVSGEW